jgi:drug/metabolite transporter (DMT)-like permease
MIPTTVPQAVLEARRGIGWMLVTMILFVSMDTVAKHLTALYPVPQVVWARFVFHTLLIGILLAPRARLTMVTQRPGLQFLRSTLLLATTILFFSGLRILPMAESAAMMQVGPLVITALSVPLLGELVGIRRWMGVIAGFAGALLIIRPGSEAMQIAILLPLAAAVSNALYQITTRILSRSESTVTILFYTPLTGALLMSAVVPLFWVTPDAEGWAMMALLGLIGGVSHFTLIKAFTAAPAATVAPFGYSSLIWATLSGLVFFGDFPDRWTIVGALVIAGSGLYILHREHVRKRSD